mmetsp:Transcript_3069/g.6253  ORF Transcript_3069/g.6253 Transcript_3069/m.6253 type:complete len:209 (+) Transcript_3069:2044-2670(+)
MVGGEGFPLSTPLRMVPPRSSALKDFTRRLTGGVMMAFAVLLLLFRNICPNNFPPRTLDSLRTFCGLPCCCACFCFNKATVAPPDGGGGGNTGGTGISFSLRDKNVRYWRSHVLGGGVPGLPGDSMGASSSSSCTGDVRAASRGANLDCRCGLLPCEGSPDPRRRPSNRRGPLASVMPKEEGNFVIVGIVKSRTLAGQGGVCCQRCFF